ncbi:hypothetical protein M9H77_26880 [Catharanthus roseus]|uniref:Uncharacterized protein n=1 Tax=Catharanthus roseus TaxID=4058 RepID=A0ACC0ACC8_CATRO|nr:hypothetical protein M9H77_26880 [Catharanthus roseus]
MARYLKNGLLVKTPKGSVKTKDIINSCVKRKKGHWKRDNSFFSPRIGGLTPRTGSTRHEERRKKLAMSNGPHQTGLHQACIKTVRAHSLRAKVYKSISVRNTANVGKFTAQPGSEFPFKAIYLFYFKKAKLCEWLKSDQNHASLVKIKIWKLKGQMVLISIVPSSLEALEQFKESI